MPYNRPHKAAYRTFTLLIELPEAWVLAHIPRYNRQGWSKERAL